MQKKLLGIDDASQQPSERVTEEFARDPLSTNKKPLNALGMLIHTSKLENTALNIRSNTTFHIKSFLTYE